MPPSAATLLCLGFVAWLIRRDIRENPNVTSALWLPFFWIFISGSRFISEWLAIFGINLGAVNVEEGSPIDAVFFAVIIGGGVYVLIQRRATLARFVSDNRWLTCYLLYCLAACAWSDFPFVAAKRWTKLFGQPVMALVLLTEPDPVESMTRLFKRFAFSIVPLSIVFIKYYPALGRTFDSWSGQPTNTGVTTNKNSLGCDCFILCFFFTWYIMQVWRWQRGVPRRKELLLCASFLGMTGWTLYQAHSSTSEGAFIVGASLLFFLGFKFLDRRRVTGYLVTIGAGLGLAQFLFGIQDVIIEALGRNTTLTGRTDIWHVLLNWPVNPIIGTGFESFWLGPRVDQINSQFGGLILNEAHNGYLETYINLGLLGLFILAIMVFSAYFNSRRAYLVDFELGRFRIAYLAAFLMYNWTEAAFRTHAVPFFVFFFIAIEYHASTSVAATSAGKSEPAPEPDSGFGGSAFPAQGLIMADPGGGVLPPGLSAEKQGPAGAGMTA